MKKFIAPFLLSLMLLFASCTNTSNNTKPSKTDEVVEALKGQQQAGKAKDGVFIHLSHGPEDPQRVLMALNMAKMMSDNKEVLFVY
jgi:hypothetical protein